MSDEILLESGTNEVEILEFYLGSQSFGINVAKVLQIELLESKKVTRTPDAGDGGHIGVYLWRGTTMPLIDLAEALDHVDRSEVDRPLAMITEFNQIQTAFLVDGVNQVYRVGWERMEPISSFVSRFSNRTSATLQVNNIAEDGTAENIELLILDFEAIVADFCPETKLDYGEIKLEEAQAEVRRGSMKLLVAEDSGFLRSVILRTLKEAGYENLSVFSNGLEALKYIEQLRNQQGSDAVDLAGLLDLVITDIEMPLMDGLTLCRRIKKELRLSGMPVVFFSSLINEQMKVKCAEVGGDGQITKPEIGDLVSLVDRLCYSR